MNDRPTSSAATAETLLNQRGVVAVSGVGAVAFLDKLVTNDLEGIGAGEARFAGLLSPQGKVLFEFNAVRVSDDEAGDTVLLDVAAASVLDLVKRLTVYKLRSPVTIADVSGDHAVCMVATGGGPMDGAVAVYADPRASALPRRVIVKRSVIAGTVADDTAAYDALRIAARVPELGRDYTSGEVVAHEALLDRLNGVSFSKGCYVGQEIVARMEHRGTARKRFVRISAAVGDALPPIGSEVRAGEALVGAMGSSVGANGLALLRLDRLGEFAAKDVALMAGGVAVVPDAADVAELMPKAPDPIALD